MFFLYALLFFCLIALTISSKWIFKTIWNPIFFINIVYLVWSFFGRLALYNQFLPSEKSACFVLANIIVINIFILLGTTIKISAESNSNLGIDKPVLFTEKRVRIILLIIRLICFFINLTIFFNLLSLLLSGSVSIEKIRDLSYSMSYGSNDYLKIYINFYLYYFYQYFIRGFVFFDLTFSVASYLKLKKRISPITILNFGLWIFIMLSRIEVMKTIILSLIIILFSGVKITKTQRKKVIPIIVIVLAMIFSIMSFRNYDGGENTLLYSLRELIIDFSGSNYMFSYYFDLHLAGNAVADLPYITKLLGGIWLLFEYVLEIFFGIYFGHSAVNEFLTVGHSIGSSTHYNAFYTMFFDFLNTGGVAGCIFFSMLIGFVVGMTYKAYKEKQSLKMLYISAFFVYLVVMGTYNFAFNVPAAFALLCALFYRDSRDYRNITAKNSFFVGR